VESDEDVDRYVDINQSVAGEGGIARRLIRDRPGAMWEDFLMVVERESGRVVSTTCLLRWQLSFQGVPLTAAMLEMVVTDPAYRRLGMVRAQMQAFHERACAQGADLFVVQGIPYYYRQFGYGYALDHTPVFEVEAERAPPAERSSALRLRPAGASDAPALETLYGIEMSRQGLHVRRNVADWEYLLTRTGRTFEIIERRGAADLAGYVLTLPKGGRVMVAEAGIRHPGDAAAALAILRARSPGSLLVCGNQAHALSRAAGSRGGVARIPGQWLVRIANPALLLSRLGPVLERRLTAAGFGEIDAEILINLYRNAIHLRIVGGKIAAVEDAGFVNASSGPNGGELCIPPDAFTRLVLGYRDLDQIRDAWPDTVIHAEARPILDSLFPRTDSLILMPY
jgi:predicted N-acetyltransferase YhbS